MSLDRRRLAASLCLIAGLLFPAALAASAAVSVLFANVRIFDGVEPTLTAGHVLVTGNTIARVSAEPIEPPAERG